MPPNQIAAYVAWHGDRFYYLVGANPSNRANKARSFIAVDENFNTAG